MTLNELYQISTWGGHHGMLFHGNCVDILQKMDKECINFVLTDIPYNISQKNNLHTMRGNKTGLDFGEWDKGWDINDLTNLIDLITPNGGFLTFHAFEQYSDLRKVLKDLELKDRLVWQKTNPMPRNRDRRYVNSIEMVSWFVKPKGKWVFNRQSDKFDSNVLTYPIVSGNRLHPTEKNLNMMIDLVLRHTNENDIILDPYMGSGTTCVAAIRTGRRYIGIELDEGYYKIAEERIKQEEDKKYE